MKLINLHHRDPRTSFRLPCRHWRVMWESPAGERFANRNCVWCHGPSLQGFSTAPRLAGQSPQYIMNQLYGFRDHARDNPLSRQYMWGAAANHLSLQTAHNLALYLATLSPKSANDGYEALAASGRAIYQEGIPDANIPSCVACHGPNAEGAAAEGAGQIPRLGGLSYYYLKRRLEQWGEGYHPDRVASRCPKSRANCRRTTLRRLRPISALSGELQKPLQQS